MKMNRTLFLALIFLGSLSMAQGQDLLEILDDETKDTVRYTQATFKSNRLLLGQSVETRRKGALEVRLDTKYWNRADSDADRGSFAADLFTGRLGLDYAFTNRFTLGGGISSFDGIIDGYGKYRLLRQRDDPGKSPIGITLFQGTSYFTRSYARTVLPENSDRFNFITKLMFARKFSRNFSLQIAPIYLHTNSRQLGYETNDFFALGVGGRYKLGNHVALASEYTWVAGRDEGPQGYNTFVLGVNWEVGDLVFQFSMTNAVTFDETATILFGPENFNMKNGALHIGVGVTYIFHLKRPNLGIER